MGAYLVKKDSQPSDEVLHAHTMNTDTIRTQVSESASGTGQGLETFGTFLLCSAVLCQVPVSEFPFPGPDPNKLSY